jgi:hypothetical protein
MTPLELVLLVALLTAVSLALVLQRRLTRFRKGEGAPGSGAPGGHHGKKVPVTPRRQVNVTVNKAGSTLSVAVDPWLVAIEKDAGKGAPPVQWNLDASGLAGPITWSLAAKAPGSWPFDGQEPTPAVNGNAPILPGNVSGHKDTMYSYTIRLSAGGESYDIDPEIFIC